jgi:hypothetical protein
MITNYYNIPNIPCSDRLKITSDQGIDTLKCSGLNPDNVFGTLFPDRADPTINYDVTSSKKITAGSLIGTVSEKDAKNCAQDCSTDKTCTYFTVEKAKNQCRLYSTKEATKNNKFASFDPDYNIRTWRKNDLLDGTKNCNIEDGFIGMDTNYFPNVEDANKFEKKSEQIGLSKNECLSACLYDDTCNSVVFMDSKSKCEKRGSLTRATAQNALGAAPTNPEASTYLKKAEVLANRFGITDNMLDYYKTYSSSGKIGDSFCEFIQDENKCMTSYIVGPNNQKEVPSTNAQTVTKVPAPKLCMPPNCIPKLPETGLRGKLKVDGSFNIMCPPGSGDDAKDCVKAIDKTPFVTFDRMGLPTDNDASNPPNGYLPYTLEYDTYNNLEIPASALTGSGDACVAKPMNEGEKPSIGSMEFPEDCQNWCNKSVDCGGYSYYFGSDGKAKCDYYQNIGMKGLKDALKPKKDTHTLIKRGNRYVQKPLQGEIKKPYFNNSSAADTGVSKERVCIPEGFTSQYQDLQEGFTDKYCPFPYNKTPASDTDKIFKDDDNGSNCPTPLVKCADTRYGCCPDNETAKVNSAGSNCPITSRAPCLASKYGCCPGTVIPMQYLCDKEGDDLCKMTNCELNDNERGDPYAFYGGKGVKCTNNSSCPAGQMCVDGFCKNYNEKYYNGLNGAKMAAMHTQSGNSMNDLLCGCQSVPVSTTCDNTIYDPVCGVDRKTYRSRCVAENLGIKVEHYGACEDILEKFYNLDDFKMPVKNNKTSYWVLVLLLVLLVGSILYCFR